MAYAQLLLGLSVAVLQVSAVRPTNAGVAMDRPLPENLRVLLEKLTPECQKDMKGLMTDLMSKCLEITRQIAGEPVHPANTPPELMLTNQRGFCEEELRSLFTGDGFPTDQWLPKLATSDKESILWAGFWDGDGAEPERTSKRALFDFANMIDKATVHLSTELGQIVYKHRDLQMCSKDPVA